MAVKYGSLPFDAQIAFFRKKLALSTRSWADIVHGHHDHAFVVAGANRQALVEDFQVSVQQAIENGTTLAAFRKDFDRIVAEHGWEYNGTRGWRSRVIYETNLRTSYQAGRYTQLQTMDFWQYHHSPASENARQQHLQWDGLILAKDDPFWDTNYPPNGFGCKCTVTGHSKATMQRKGLKPSKSPKLKMRTVEIGTRGPSPRKVQAPDGVGPGWAYAPGRDAWIHAHALPPINLPNGFSALPRIPNIPAHDLMPAPREFSASKILPAMKVGDDEKYANAFLNQFGAAVGKEAVFKDVAGEAIVVSDALFKDFRGEWKINKEPLRSTQLNMLAETIRDPDEVWAWMDWNNLRHKAVAYRVYLSRYHVNGKEALALVVMERGAGWAGVTAHTSKSVSELSAKVEKNRRGVRLYKRRE